MAEKIVVAQLDIDRSELQKAAAESKKSLEELKKEQKELLKSTENLSKANEEEAKTYVTLDAAIKKTSKQYNEQIKLLNDTDKAMEEVNKEMDKEIKTIGQAESQNKKLQAAKKNVNATTIEGKEAIKDINKRIDENNEFIKDNSDALSKQKQNIGNYQSALEGLPGPLDSINQGFKTFIANPVVLTITAIVGALTGLRDAFSRSSEGQDLLAKGMGILNGAVTTLQIAFDKFAEIVIFAFEEPEKAWDTLVDAFKTGSNFIQAQVIDRLSGGWTVTAGVFEAGVLRMRIAWNEFTGDAEEAAVLEERMKAVTEEVQEGAKLIEQANEDLKQVAVDAWGVVTNAANQAIETTQKYMDIEVSRAQLRRAEIDNITEIAEIERDISSLRSEASDKTAEAESRILAVAEAEKLVLERADSALELARARLALKQSENALSNSGLDDLREEAELQAEVINLEKERVDQVREFTELRSALLDELADKEIKRIESTAAASSESLEEELRARIDGYSAMIDELNLTDVKRSDVQKLLVENQVALEEELSKQRIASLEASSAAETAFLNRVVEDSIAQRQALQNSTIAATEETQAAILSSIEVENQARRDQIALENQLAVESIEAEKLSDQEKKAALLEQQILFDEQMAELKLQTDNTFFEAETLHEQRLNEQHLADLSSRNKSEFAIEKTRVQQQTDLQKKLATATIENEELLQQQLVEIDRQAAQQQVEIERAKTIAVFESASSLAGSLAGVLNEGSAAYKAVAIFQAGLDLAGAVLKALNTPFPANLVAIGTVLATGAGFVSTIKNAVVPSTDIQTPAPTFSDGGGLQMLNGPSHAAGGVPIYFGNNYVGEAEGGEIVGIMNRKASQAFMDFNNMYTSSAASRTKFQTGGAITPGGIGISPEDLSRAIAEGFERVPAPVVAVTDINEGQARVNVIDQSATI